MSDTSDTVAPELAAWRESGQPDSMSNAQSSLRLAASFAMLLLLSCSSDAPGPSQSATSVTTEDLYIAFRDQPVAAQQRFAGKALQVTGTVASIELVGDDGALFLQAPSATILSVDFADPAGANLWLARIKAGDRVTVRCASVKPLGDILQLRDCAAPG